MQLYLFTSRTLTLRLHFYLGNVSLVTQISPSLEGDLLTSDPALSIRGPPPNAFGGQTVPARAPRGNAHQDLSKTLESSRTTVFTQRLKTVWLFFPFYSCGALFIPSVLSFPLRISKERFHQDEWLPGHLEDSFPVGREDQLWTKPVACMTSPIDSAFPGKSVSRWLDPLYRGYIKHCHTFSCPRRRKILIENSEGVCCFKH